jgi:hypothetical protein
MENSAFRSWGTRRLDIAPPETTFRTANLNRSPGWSGGAALTAQSHVRFYRRSRAKTIPARASIAQNDIVLKRCNLHIRPCGGFRVLAAGGLGYSMFP